MANVLAIDAGEKKIGIAVGDTILRMGFARPALEVNDWSEAWPKIQHMIAEERIDRVVVGLPKNTDNTIGPQGLRAKEFAQALGQHIELTVELRDERYSTQAVIREQQAAGRKLKRGEDDSLAAQLILESYLAEEAHE